jgi:hypothetical protein
MFDVCRITAEQQQGLAQAVAKSKRAETARKYDSQYHRYLVSVMHARHCLG